MDEKWRLSLWADAAAKNVEFAAMCIAAGEERSLGGGTLSARCSRVSLTHGIAAGSRQGN